MESESRLSEDYPPSRFTCPDCGGTLFEVHEGAPHRVGYTCRVGHRYSGESLVEAQDHLAEDALWASIRMMDERRDLADQMAERARRSGRTHAVRFFERKADEARRRGEALRQLMKRDERFDSDGRENAPNLP